jgi:hypothetical protein
VADRVTGRRIERVRIVSMVGPLPEEET